MHEERIARILDQPGEGLFRRERAGLLAVARAARAPLAAEFRHVEESPALLEPRLGARVGQGRIAIEASRLDDEQESRYNRRSTTLHIHDKLPSLDSPER